MQRLRIFVVENDPDTRKYFAMYLEQIGHSVVTGESIGATLTTLREARFDVLIADIGLADGSGWDIPSRLLEAGIACPRFMIAMTGFGGAADRQLSEHAGFRHHLLKPLDFDALNAALADAAAELGSYRDGT